MVHASAPSAPDVPQYKLDVCVHDTTLHYKTPLLSTEKPSPVYCCLPVLASRVYSPNPACVGLARVSPVVFGYVAMVCFTVRHSMLAFLIPRLLGQRLQ